MQLYMIMAVIGLVWSAGITGAGYVKGWSAATAKAELQCAADAARQREETDKIIAIEYKAVQDTERTLRAFKDNQEITDAENQQKIDALSGRVRTLGRLRDPHGKSGCGPQGAAAAGTGDRADNTTDAGGLLSGQLTQLLARLTREADEINNAYRSCRADAFSVRGDINQKK